MEAVQNASKKSAFSDYRVRLSCIFMGLGQLFCRQFIKGALLMLLEIGFILFLVFAGVENIIGLFTLGTTEGVPIMGIEGDNSVSMLAWGITTVVLVLLFALAYYANIKDVVYTVGEIEKGNRVKNFFESCQTLLNKKFYFLTLTLPLVFVCIFNVMPIVFTALVAFTDYGGEIVPPKLVSWTGFQSFRVIFTMSEYIGTMGKILAWNVLWAVGSTFLVYFGGLGLALLYNAKCLKWKRFWRVFPMFAYAIPSFITLTGFYFMFCDSGPIVGLLKDWGWVKENFTIISYDSKWSLRLLGFFCCAWVGCRPSCSLRRAFSPTQARICTRRRGWTAPTPSSNSGTSRSRSYCSQRRPSSSVPSSISSTTSPSSISCAPKRCMRPAISTPTAPTFSSTGCTISRWRTGCIRLALR